MPTTPAQALPYPALSDPANGPTAFQGLALAIDTKIVMRFASVAARNTAIPTPASGMVAYTTAENTLWVYRSSAWRAGMSYALDTLFAVKTATESVTSSTTLQNDDDLTVTVVASATYIIELILSYDGLTTVDLKTALTLPAGATIVGAVQAIAQAGSATTDDFNGVWSGAVNPGCLGVGTTAAMHARGVLTVAGTSGAVTLQWAQLVSAATAVRMFAGSFMSLRRVA